MYCSLFFKFHNKIEAFNWPIYFIVEMHLTCVTFGGLVFLLNYGKWGIERIFHDILCSIFYIKSYANSLGL